MLSYEFRNRQYAEGWLAPLDDSRKVIARRQRKPDAAAVKRAAKRRAERRARRATREARR